MKTLFFTDAHNSDYPPRMRKQSYTQDILLKQEELIPIAKECDLTIMGGDVFNLKKSARVSYWLTNALMEIYRQLGDVIIVPGNHDFEFHSDEVNYKSPIALLGKLPNVTILNVGHIEFWDTIIFGMGCGDYYAHTETIDAVEAYMNAPNIREMNKVKIMVLHSSVTNTREYVYAFDVMPVHRFTPVCDVLCLGHLHDFQQVDSSVVAPGALSRGVLRLDDRLDRDVGYAVFETEKGTKGALSSEFVKLDVKKPEEVFFLEKKLTENAQKAAVSKLIEFIDALDVPKAMGRDDLMEYIDGMDKLDETVKQTALRLLRGL